MLGLERELKEKIKLSADGQTRPELGTRWMEHKNDGGAIGGAATAQCGSCTDGGIVRGPDMGWLNGLNSSLCAQQAPGFPSIPNWAGPCVKRLLLSMSSQL